MQFKYGKFILIPFLFFHFVGWSQLPERTQMEGQLDQAVTEAAKKALMCNDAGTILSRNFIGNFQSNDIEFLCFNDSMAVVHAGNADLSGDPDPSTAPGVGYAVYYCNPTIDGMDLATILMDPCLVDNPPPPPGSPLWVVTDQINGDAIFSNIAFPPMGTTVMDFYNGGDPVELIYAPITIDEFNLNEFESAGGGPPGPCVDVSIDEAFPVVYLNPISIEISDDMVGCDCSGDFSITVDGGLPEYDLSSNYSVTIRNAVSGQFVLNNDPISLLTSFDFSIMGPGDYEVIIEDGKSCDFFEVRSLCADTQVDVNVGEITGSQGDTVCVPVSVSCLSDILAFQFTLNFDSSIVDFVEFQSDLITITPGNFFEISTGTYAVTWDSPTLFPVPLTGNDTLFNICFELIGDPGDQSCVDINGSQTALQIAISDGNGGFIGIDEDNINVNKGNVNIMTTTLQITDTLIQHVIRCSDDLTGAIDVTVSGGVEPYTYLWVTPTGTLMTQDISGVPAGNYQLTVRDSDVPPNEVIIDLTIDGPEEIDAFTNRIQPSCFDSSDGCLIVDSITGGQAPYSWRWLDSQGNTIGTPNRDTICGFDRGTYTIRVVDINGCIHEESIELSADPLGVRLDNDNSVTRVTCNPGNDGRLALIITGGDISVTGSYGITWSNNVMNDTFIDNLGVGNYSVTVTDDRGCENIRDNMSIVPAQAPFVTFFDSVSISCPGASDGSLIAFYQSPISPITGLEWSTGETTDSIGNLSSGWYYITITAEDGCQGLDSAFLADPGGVDLDPSIRMNPSCFGYADGSVQIVPNGPLVDIGITWSNGDMGVFADSLAAGTYTAYFTDTIRGCLIDSLEVLLTQPFGMSLNFNNIQPATCFDQIICDGSATLQVSGGFAPGNNYDITWDNSQVDGNTNISTNNTLCSGWNLVSVEDEAGCIIIDSVEISSPPELLVNQADIVTMEPSCTGFSDGEIRLAIEGGISPYTVTWFDGTNGPIKTDLPAGSHDVTVEDFNGCQITTSVTLNDPDSFYVFVDINASKLSVDCSGDTDGSIVLRSSFANTNGFMYDWTPNVSNTIQADNLAPGFYSVVATSDQGCQDTATAIISGVPMIQCDIPIIAEPVCFGGQTMFVVDGASGGNGAPFSYRIQEEGIELNIADSFPLFAGTYTISIVDNDGCTKDTSIVITQPDQLLVNIPHDTIIRGQELILAELGEERKFTFQYVPISVRIDSLSWNFEDGADYRAINPDSTIIASKLTSSQNLEVFVIDENGCTASDIIFIKLDKDRNVFIPNSFSPDGNNINDVFAVYSGTGVVNISSYQIFDRWGSLIYELRDIDPLVFNSNAVGWDGTHNGKELNPAVFVYLIEVEFEDGVSLLYRGDISLMK